MMQALLQKRSLRQILKKEITYTLKTVMLFCDNSIKMMEKYLPGFKVRLCIVVCHTLLRSGNKRILA